MKTFKEIYESCKLEEGHDWNDFSNEEDDINNLDYYIRELEFSKKWDRPDVDYLEKKINHIIEMKTPEYWENLLSDWKKDGFPTDYIEKKLEYYNTLKEPIENFDEDEE